MIDFSFIIPIYNVNIDKLKKSIDSIVKQNIANYEILLINDGSTDNQIELFCNNITKENLNIKYFYQNNSGSAVARNTGLENAQGKYIVFVDSDDELHNDFFSKYKKIKNKNLEFFIFDYSFCDIKNEHISSFGEEKDFTKNKNEIYSNILFYPNKLQNFMFGSIWGKCFSKKFLDKNNIRFIPRLRKAQDRMFMLNVIYFANKVKYYPIHCYKYRTNINSISHKMNFKMVDYYYALYTEITNFIKTKKINPEVTKHLEYSIFNELLPLTVFHIENKNSYKTIKNQYIEIYNKFQLKENLKKLKIIDIPSVKGKIKYILFKYNQIYLLHKLFLLKQKKDNQKYFTK